MPEKRRRNTAGRVSGEEAARAAASATGAGGSEEEAESPTAFASAAALASLSLQVQHMKAGWIKSFVALQAIVQTQQSRCEISSCAGSLESAKTDLTKNVDAKVDALEEKIQGLKKGAEDLEEDIGKTLAQVKDGAERALSATKVALLEALEKHKAESLKALQTAKTELTKEREEAEGRTTAASEAQEGSRAGEEDNTEVPAAWVESLSLEEQQECVHQGKITWTLAVRKYPDKIADFLLSREIGETITKQQLKTCCDALKGIGVTVGLNSTDAGVLWKKLRPGD